MSLSLGCGRLRKRRLAISSSFFAERLEARTLMSVTLTTLASFDGVGIGAPAVDSSGNVYLAESDGKTGTAFDGYGSILRFAAGSNKETTLATFDAANSSAGLGPVGVTIDPATGNLYGATSAGGPHGNGNLFKIPAGTSTLIPDYPGVVGGSSLAPLVVGT